MDYYKSQPGIGTSRTSTPRTVLLTHGAIEAGDTLPGGGVISGAASRDPLNAHPHVLQAGLLMGKITASGKYAPSVIGVLSAAYDASADTTSITVSAATATELVRRQGSSGTFKLTGPPTAAGVVQTVTVTYSAVNTTTGVITLTALDVDVDEVHTITNDAAITGGVVDITYYTSAGVPVHVTTPWDTDWATTMAAWNVASTAAATVVAGEASVGAVMTGTATVQVLTFSGVGFAALAPSELSAVDVGSATGPEYATVAQTTAAAEASGAGSNDFVAGSLVQPTDGSETVLTFLVDSNGYRVTDIDAVSIDIPFRDIPVRGMLDASQILNYGSDASIQAHIKAALRAPSLGYVFDDDF